MLFIFSIIVTKFYKIVCEASGLSSQVIQESSQNGHKSRMVLSLIFDNDNISAYFFLHQTLQLFFAVSFL